MKVFMILIAALSGYGQTVTVAAQSGTSQQSTQLTIVAKSTTTFALSSATASGTGAASLNLTASTTRFQVQPIALGFTVNWTAADASGVSVSPGPALTGIGKTLTCTGTTALACTISGGSMTIPNGTAAIVALTANKTTTLALTSVSATNRFGVPLLTAITPGGVVTVSVLLASMTCASSQIESGEDVVCAANLNQVAPSTGVVVQVSSSAPTTVALVNSAGTAISSVTIPAGSLSGGFIARGL